MPIKALVIDDDILILGILEMFLTSNEVDVLTRQHATCAMYERKSSVCPLDKPEVDFIISDNNMPGMTGIEFYEDIDSKDCKLPNKRKALLSGGLTENIRNRAERLGIEVFEKPCSFEMLGRWIDTVVKYDS